MAIAFDSAAGLTGGAGITTLDQTLNNAAGDLLVVGCSSNNNSTHTVTYNGVTATQVASVVSGGRKASLHILAAPATGSHTLNFSIDSSSTVMRVASATYSGCKQSGQPDASNTGSDSTTPFDISVTTATNNCWVVGWFVDTDGSAVAAGTGTTRRTSAAQAGIIGDSNAAITPAGSASLQATGTSSDISMQIIVAISPTPPTSIKTFNGLAYASTKTVDGVAIASVKTWGGLA